MATPPKTQYSGGVGLPEGKGIPRPAKPKPHKAPPKHPTHKRVFRPKYRMGAIVRFSPIPSITPKNALDRMIWLPVLLNSFSITEEALHNEYDTLTAGHFSQPAMGPSSARQFRTSTFESMVCDMDPSWFAARGQDPWIIETKLFEILRARHPVRVMIFRKRIQREHHDLDAFITFRRITKEVRGGENDTRYLTIDVSEWRNPKTQRRTSRKRHIHLPTTHKLKKTDTLATLSHEYYGTATDWRHIRDANGISHRWGQKTLLVKLGGHYKVGYKIKIPKLPDHKKAPAKGNKHPGSK